MNTDINKGTMIYWCRFATGDLYELKVRTVTDTYFVGSDTKDTKQAFLFGYNDIGVSVFLDRNEALKTIKEYKKTMKKYTETEYEEF